MDDLGLRWFHWINAPHSFRSQLFLFFFTSKIWQEKSQTLSLFFISQAEANSCRTPGVWRYSNYTFSPWNRLTPTDAPFGGFSHWKLGSWPLLTPIHAEHTHLMISLSPSTACLCQPSVLECTRAKCVHTQNGNTNVKTDWLGWGRGRGGGGGAGNIHARCGNASGGNLVRPAQPWRKEKKEKRRHVDVCTQWHKLPGHLPAVNLSQRKTSIIYNL